MTPARRIFHRILMSIFVLSAGFARANDALPPSWSEIPPVGGWRAEGSPDSPVFKSDTRVDGSSALVFSFLAASGPMEITFQAMAPAVDGQRGLNFGTGWLKPQKDAYKANFLTFGGGGQVIFWDASMVFEASSNVGAYVAGKLNAIRMVVDPSLGGFSLEINGKPAKGTYPFFSGIPRIDSLYFTNASTRAEASPLEIRDLRIRPLPAPPTPLGLEVRALSPTVAEVAWRPSPGAAGYRIYRQGKKVGETDAAHLFWRESGLPESRPVAYSVTAVGANGEESLPTWPTDVMLPLSETKTPTSGPYDLVVTGGTPSAIAASLAAARHGAKVLMAIPDDHLGGMMTGGLERTDFRYMGAQGGIFAEFLKRIENYYRDAYGPDSREVVETRNGYVMQAKVADRVFRRMLDEEPRVRVRYGMRPVRAAKKGDRLVAVTFQNASGEAETIRADAFIDATYEGDLLALAGVDYRVGRESRAEYGEEHAGIIYWDVAKMDFLPGSSGDGDHRVQAYNYRLPLANRAGLRDYRLKPPAGYDRSLYAGIAQDVADGKIRSVARILDFRRVPGEEYDVNNNRYYPSTDFIGHSDDYPDADPTRRAEIAADHRRYEEGLLYFLQYDDRLPSEFRFEANQWGLSEEEFQEDRHFPNQLYVREARRMIGEYVFNENDARPAKGSERTPYFEDSIAVGDYMMDSHATRPQEPDRPMGVLEGFFFIPALTKPYQIPYRILLPKRVDGLLVSVAVSATHVGYGTLRMEPAMMAMGEAAGTAVQIARYRKERLRAVSIPELQRELLREGATLAFFSDLTPDRPDFQAFQALGALGLFDSYRARPGDPLSATDAARWLDATARRLNVSFAKSAPWSGVTGEDAVSAGQWAKWLSAFGEKPILPAKAPDEKIDRSDAAISLYAILSR